MKPYAIAAVAHDAMYAADLGKQPSLLPWAELSSGERDSSVRAVVHRLKNPLAQTSSSPVFLAVVDALKPHVEFPKLTTAKVEGEGARHDGDINKNALWRRELMQRCITDPNLIAELLLTLMDRVESMEDAVGMLCDESSTTVFRSPTARSVQRVVRNRLADLLHINAETGEPLKCGASNT